MPLIHVDMSAGKASEEQKRELIEQLTEAVSAVLGEAQRSMTVITL
jgi:4-oxalocrotonate tautomerase family enzyme